jgi:hypothetical protein
MTANELADWIEGQGNGGAGNMHSQTATMLREQQAEIEALKKEAALQRLSDFTQEAESFDRTASHMAGKRELTNEEIESAWFKVFKPESGIGKNITNGVYEFARLIRESD